jgi:NAD(P)-dependent dehydrogenase (short-subunit alcohol dehydrogenase family)
MRFDGKVCLITGAGSGIGRATAIGFAQRGGKVVVADVNGDSAEQVAAEVAAAGGSATSIVADMASPADVDAMVARTVERFGRLDVLHNKAFGVPATLRQNRLARSAEID